MNKLIIGLLTSTILLTGCGSIGTRQSSFESAQRAASPEGIAKQMEADRLEQERREESAKVAQAALKSRCLGYQANWQSAGYEQGKAGSTADSYYYQLDQCKQFNLKFNQKQWDAGFRAGMLKHYCTYNTAFYSAVTGGYVTLRERCDPLMSVNRQQNMEIMYQKGLIFNDAKKALFDAEYALSNLNREIDRNDYYGKTPREVRREWREATDNVMDSQREVMELEREAQRLFITLGQ
ncbi:DUF2799 domain-containing protein [Providencia sp. wls1914]|nr:DUF2799 domain-containing protein [Providencia sp. wls1914]